MLVLTCKIEYLILFCGIFIDFVQKLDQKLLKPLGLAAISTKMGEMFKNSEIPQYFAENIKINGKFQF